jgi:outer membrane lipoprotein-sorting protein
VIKTAILIWFFTMTNVLYVWAQQRSDVARWVEEAEALLDSVDNYTATFYRQARVKGELKDKETMLFKFKKPFMVYLKWTENPHKGRELLYVEGENSNRIKMHGTGLLGSITINIDPRSSFFMKFSRHPITEIGIDFITDVIGREFRRGIDCGEIEIIYRGEEMVFRRKTMKIEGVFPKDVGRGYYCSRAVVHVDLETKIPISVEVYDWENRLLEYYGFENLILNAGLDKDDFDPKDARYGF